MRNLLFTILLALLTGVTQAKTDVEYAEEARQILSKHGNVGQGIERVCKDVERVKKKAKVVVRECKVVTWDNVLLAIKQPLMDFQFVMARIDTCASFDQKFKITCKRDRFGQTNGLNTCFTVEQPFGYKVYGIRRLGKTRFGKREMVYSPYCDELNTPATVEEGRAYLDRVIDEAYEDLRKREVVSRSFPGKLVVDVIPKSVIHNLALIEHMDEERFLALGAAPLAAEVYTTLALNERYAYNLGASRAAALGLLQFTLRTYISMALRYPGAGLIKGFFDGAYYHVNSAKAAVLLLDHDLSLLQPAEREAVLNDWKTMHGYFASTYNGGPSCPKNKRRNNMCAVQMYRTCGEFAKCNPSRENRIYVQKMHAVANLRKQTL